MSVSLLQPSALNASAVQVAFPPLSPPDLFNCDKYYSTPSYPVPSDCRTAFEYLPSGYEPTLWYTEPAAGEFRNVLPLIVHHGTCEIIFHTSGQSAGGVDHFVIVPNDIRAMASWVIGRCCSAGKGGMATKYLQNTLSAITDSRVRWFPDPALPPRSSFYSLHIWNYIGTDTDWNPGNNEPDVGGAIDDSLREAVKAAPAGSSGKMELERRQDWLWDAVGRMDHGDPVNWWDGRSSHTSASGRANLTRGCSSSRDCHGDSTTA